MAVPESLREPVAGRVVILTAASRSLLASAKPALKAVDVQAGGEELGGGVRNGSGRACLVAGREAAFAEAKHAEHQIVAAFDIITASQPARARGPFRA